jgi:MFS family permease
MHDRLLPASPPDHKRWYQGISRYQWLVLVIACAGWVFDQYESQIFVLTHKQLLAEIFGADGGAIKLWGDRLFAVFLVGGMIGGLAAGSLADRYGRRPILVLTILFYSLFSGLTYFASELWHVIALRFLVAMGVGGEWAVAASLVAEVFPPRARAYASGIFHSSSVLGIWMATLAALAVGAEWRYAYLVGIIPALLVVWVRASVREPEKWKAAAEDAQRAGEKRAELGSIPALLSTSPWNRRAMLGVALAAVGLGTFWSVIVAGQALAEERLLRDHVSPAQAAEQSKFAYGFVQTAGGGLGLLSFGPISARIGRRRAFIAFQLLAFAIVPITCYVPQSYEQLLLLLPVFGFLTLGIHAGYAIYFPELFPTHLRATGSSMCFNGGRIVAVPVLLLSAEMKNSMDLRMAVCVLASLFFVGVILVLFLPETNRQELPA